MTRHDFLQRFKLRRLKNAQDTSHFTQHNNALREAAVLIAFTEVDNELEVILTKRAAHLKHHPGQISFPGGKVELEDKSLIETALREAKEEIGLNYSSVKVVGQLNNYHTVSGFIISPVIAMVNKPQAFVIDKSEVSEVFTVPFRYFIDQSNHYQLKLTSKKITHDVHFMPYEHYNIWGATAAILKDLVSHIAVK